MKKFAYDFEKPLIELEEQLEALKQLESAEKEDIATEISFLEKQIDRLRVKIYSNLTPWQIVQIARHPDRPRCLDYIEAMFTDFIELHGDRKYGDDASIIGGFARFNNTKVMVIGNQKGRNTKENIQRNFGMSHPEGYRKADRLMVLAEKCKLPVIAFVDTPGAYPGIDAEERGQAVAIAENLMRLSNLRVPVIVANIGEGGSGGALAIGFGDRIVMLENSYYSVITPEAFVSILWDGEGEGGPAEAAEALNLTADKLLQFGIVDSVIKEPLGGAHHAPALAARSLKKEIEAALQELMDYKEEDLINARYGKIRAFGQFVESAALAK
jgi:acetyl-CoA carboxylase carboxyl transferase subunit alpha